MTDTDSQITQLQQQQSLMTAAIAALLQGRVTGADSMEAFLYALDPGLQGTLELDPPVVQSDLEDLPPKG